VNRKIILGAIIFIAVFIVGSYLVFNPSEKVPNPEEEPKPAESQETVKDLMVNESEEIKTLSIPKGIEDNCFGFLVASPDESKYITKTKFTWVRPHLGPFIWGEIERSPGKYDWHEIDKWVGETQVNNLVLLATLFPYASWDQDSCRNTSCEVFSQDGFYNDLPKKRCAPCDYKAYEKFLQKLVERYDGNGKNDMPGLEIPIKYYEILNEPDMKDPGLTFFKGSHEDLLKIMKISYETIKAKCPDCTVVQGGAAGNGDEGEEYWNEMFKLGAYNYFDIANIHFISFGDTDTLNVANFKSLLDKHNIDKPIWVTEAGLDSESEILSSVNGAFAAGAKKIFFIFHLNYINDRKRLFINLLNG